MQLQDATRHARDPATVAIGRTVVLITDTAIALISKPQLDCQIQVDTLQCFFNLSICAAYLRREIHIIF